MGSATVDTNISSTGTEVDFLSELYDYITGLWTGITCSMNVGGTEISPALPSDYQVVNNGKTYIDFALKENVILRFESYNKMSYAVDGGANQCYNIFFIINDVVVGHYGEDGSWTNKGSGLPFVSSPEKYYNNNSRKYVLSKYISDNMFIVWFGNYSVTSWKNSQFYIMGVKDTSDNWHYAAGTNIDDAVLYDSNGSNAVVKSPMFSYEARTGYLDFISHSSFVSGSTKVFTSTDIYDCTTVNFGDTLSLKNGANFLAIGEHSMVRLDEEEG